MRSAVPQYTQRMLVLMVEVEQPEGLSSRKIIVESMKHNVVTAYSGEEALYVSQRANFDIVFIHSLIRDIPCGELVKLLRVHLPDAHFVALTPDQHSCGADESIDSFRPDLLTALFRRLSSEGAVHNNHSVRTQKEA